ncbi:MAG: selenocysteine-specific translation elongation factor [Acidobacteria bacterium]|nr:selenocysteine-specific translation elongation factor [Acidobacteriota bacterium]
MTRFAVVGTAGHIDHGKSALVHALTGTDPDRLKEEKSRGITIDLGFASLEDGETQLAFVDVPGHERFVKNMLAGASGVDGVLLVVAADESVMPQTREHFDICRLLGVRTGVVALTKTDLVDDETVELVSLETAELVAGSFLEDAPVIPVSARTGEGLAALRDALFEMARHADARSPDGPVRFPIDRVFSVKGFGTVVTGTVVSGRMTTDTVLRVLPAGRDTKIRGLHVHGVSQPVAVAGQRVAANLAGMEVSDIARGDTAVTPGRFEATRRLDAVLDLLPSSRPLKHGARVRFHQGTSEVLGRVAVGPLVGQDGASEDSDRETSTDAPGELKPGASAFVRVRLESPAVLTRGDRFILRAYSPPVTIGGGIVIDPSPPRGGMRTPTGRWRLERLQVGLGPDVADEDDAVTVLVSERGLAGLARVELLARAGLSGEAADRVIDRLASTGTIRRIAGTVVDATALATVAERLIVMVTAFHTAQPLSEGVPREEVRERLFRHADPAVFEAVLADLVEAGRVVARDRLALASHQVTLSPEETRISEAMWALFADAGLSPPVVSAVPDQIGCEPGGFDVVLQWLIRHGTLVRVGPLVFDAAALDRLKDDVRGLTGPESPVRIDVGTFKDRYEVSRKFAIPLLEYLDRERVTRRVGQHRIVL